MTKRFARVPIAAASMKGLGEHALRVLIVLCAFVNKIGQCWPSLATIAKLSGIDRRQVPRAIAKLISAGIVTKVAGSAGRSATYQLHYELTSPEMSDSPLGDISTDDRVTSPEMSITAPTDISRDALTYQESEQPREQPIEGLFEPQDVPDDLETAMADWNALARELGLSAVAHLTGSRKSKLRARLKEAGGITGWRFALEKIRAAQWMHGDNDLKWKVTFDWMIRPDRFAQVMEGQHDQRQGRRRSAAETNRAAFAEMIARADREAANPQPREDEP